MYGALGYLGRTISFQDVVDSATGELFCAATPNSDASQVSNIYHPT